MINTGTKDTIDHNKYPKKDGIALYREGILQPVSFREYPEIPDYHICVCTASEKENAAEIIWLQEDSFS